MKQLIFLILLFIIFGCDRSKDIDSEDFLNNLKKAPSVNISKENLPEWLVVRINYYETRPISVQIHKGEWNKQIVFFIVDPSSACLCDFYSEDGKSIDNNLLSDLRAESINWILIYMYGDIVLTLDQIFSN